MKNITSRIAILAVCASFLAVQASAQEAVHDRAISSYAQYELHDITAKVKVHPKVMDKLTRELKLKLDGPLAQWNAAGTSPGHTGKIAIEVEVTDMKFVSGGKRFWVGGFAGASHASSTMKLIDAQSGKVLMSQNFNRVAGGMAGAWSFGATDNAMLDHLAANMADWLIALHDGGTLPATDVTEQPEAAEKPAAN